MIKQAIEQLNTVSSAVEHLRTEINRIASKLPEYPIVMEMCGIGTSLGPQLMAEIGDILCFTRRQHQRLLLEWTPELINQVSMKHKAHALPSEVLHIYEKRCFRLWTV